MAADGQPDKRANLNQPKKQSRQDENDDTPDPYEDAPDTPKSQRQNDGSQITATQFSLNAAANKINDDIEMKEDKSNEISSSSENDDSIDEIPDASNSYSATIKKRTNNPKNSKEKRKKKRENKDQDVKFVDEKNESFQKNNFDSNKSSSGNTPKQKSKSPEAESNFLKINIRFHAFVAPEFKTDGQKRRFGIISAPNWKEIRPLDIITKLNNGLVISGILDFPIKKNHCEFEYKYAMQIESDEKEQDFFIEFLGASNKNRVFKYENVAENELIERYDGIILPPDEGTKHSGSWTKRLVSIFEKIIGKFYDRNMLLNYENDTINAMFYEFEDNKLLKNLNQFKWSNFEMASKYLNNVMNGFHIFHNTTGHSVEDHKIISVLLKILSLQTDEIIKYMMALAILNYIAPSIYYTHNNFNHLFQDILLCLKINKKIPVNQLFTENSKHLVNLHNAMRKIFYYDPVRKSPLSLYLIDIISKLYFHEKREVESFMSFDESNNKDWFSYCEFTCKYSVEIKEENFYCVLKEMYKPSRIILSTCLRGVLSFKQAETESIVKIFPLDTLLHFILFCIRADINRQERSISQKHIEGNEDNILAFIKIIETSIKRNIKEKSSLEYIKLLGKMSLNIINRQSDRSTDWLKHKLMMPILVALMSKLYIWTFTELNEPDRDKKRDYILKTLVDYHKDLKSLEKPGFSLNFYNIIVEARDLNQESKELFGLQFEKEISDNFKLQSIPNLINLCKMYVDQISIHEDIKKYTYDAIIFNMDNIKKNEINELSALKTNDKLMLSRLADEVLARKWPKKENEIEIFNFIFECNHFLAAFFYLEKNNFEQSDTFKEKHAQIISLIDASLTGLENGNIVITLLRMLNKNLDVFVELLSRFSDDLSVKLWKNEKNIKLNLKKILEYRTLELDNFVKFYKLIEKFYDSFLAKTELVQTNDLKNSLSKYRNIDEMKLSDICKCLELKEIETIRLDGIEEMLNDKILEFQDIKKNNLGFIKNFIRLANKENVILLFLLNKNLQKHGSYIKIDLYIEQVLKAAYDEYLNIGKNLTDGSYLFRDFENLAKIKHDGSLNNQINQNWKDYFIILLNEISTPKDKIEERMQQIEVYQSINNIKAITATLFEIKEMYKSNGDFSFLQDIKNSLESSSFKTKSIKQIDNKTINIYKRLEDLSDQKLARCLKSFSENFEFIEWLKKTAPNLNALKLLCEFASESENEGALEVVRVQSLSMVGTAYSPLIYDLKQDFTYEDLIHQIKLLKQNLSKNPNLSEKISSISKEKSWLEEIKDSKGNTEANSLKQAIRINQTGIFDFGLEPDMKHENLSLKDVIRLRVPRRDKEPEKLYTYSQLVDLNDKLTLVVGKQRQQQKVIHEFESIFEGLINMGTIYLDLIRTGNVLFNNWTAVIYCSPNEYNTMKINFGLTNQNQNIFATRESEKTTLVSVNKTIKFLKSSYDEWLNHVNEKRNKYPVLNYFRIDQIVTLRTEIAKSISKNLNSHKNLFDLLYIINNELTVQLIDQANDAVFNEKQTPTKPKSDQVVISTEQNRIMDELLEFGFSPGLIKEAFKELNTNEFDDLLAYCTEHQMDESSTEKNLMPKNLLSFKKIKSDILLEKHDAYEYEEDELEVKYEKIWKRYSNYLDCNFEDFISLNHLGRVLNYLKAECKSAVNRHKPAFLEKGVPNLIVCSLEEIINRALNMYTVSFKERMPTDDEIIYCNARTTSEELELFWKRVLLNKEKKIYCLINVQDLMYDQAVKALMSFEKLQTDNSIEKNEFMLCIFCSSEKEDKSVFATTFNRYKKNVPIERNIEEKLNEYLYYHLVANKKASLINMDKDNLCARVITSDRSGVGKSLYVKRTIEKARDKINKNTQTLCISVKKQTLPYEAIFKQLKDFDKASNNHPRVIHIDIAYEVWYEVDFFLFDLLCLGILKSSSGEVFRRSSHDLYLIEIMSPKFKIKSKDLLNDNNEKEKPLHSVLTILPYVKCLTPAETLNYIRNCEQLPKNVCPVLFDNEILISDMIQRPCQYLQIHNSTKNFDHFEFKSPARGGKTVDVKTCLELLLKHLEHNSPSWSEIIHFSSFLNNQLIDCENSNFCNIALTGDLLPGFKSFVIKFMIQMSHDFALPSLEISDRSALQIKSGNQAAFEIEQLKMRRKWENDPHPYLFFNPDGQTFTFFGFYVNKTTGTLVEPTTGNRLFDHLILDRNLIQGIDIQDPNLLKENIANMTKEQKIYKLMRVMGVDWIHNNLNLVKDPDSSYELTMDNLLKMLAIYMRLKADIPVIIMGETGCGKTRLCKYMCELQVSPDQKNKVNNMYIVKVHGGTTTEDIIEHVNKAEQLAIQNSINSPGMFTILFFDEANSTEAIGTIKEIMCDHRINGVDLTKGTGLKIVAACNPYKKHADDIIKNFEKSGLGFYVDTNETQEKLGDLPMRHLVYRVQPLPASMLPIIWDFGQLNDDIERLYISQIVNQRFKVNNYAGNASLTQNNINLIINLLSSSQKFMRFQKNECSFVSLRDVQRTLTVIQWFLNNGKIIFTQMAKKQNLIETNQNYSAKITNNEEYYSEEETFDDAEEEIIEQTNIIDNIVEDIGLTENLINSIILALNTTYHVGLQNEQTRLAYRTCIAESFENTEINESYITEVINNCYEIFLDEISLPAAIARNQALKENVFMMLICIELKIPLFIIGKPGSSKSLAKTLIAQKMQGTDRSNSNILSTFKEAHLITFQCSPLSTAEMILKTFRYCAKYQLERKDDLDRYASVVVLDEIGLAEASPSMPLKTLHPLLEDGVHFDEEDEKAFKKTIKQIPACYKENINQTVSKQDWHRVGFIGISNWVLDPAKMNRGIVVNRSSPTSEELQDTVKGICKNDARVWKFLSNKKLINSLSTAYLNLCEKAKEKNREFFGLRDFYCLIKMIYWNIKDDMNNLDQTFLERAVRRNFGGLVDIDPVELFLDQFHKDHIRLDNYSNKTLNVIDLIKEALLTKTTEDENRYLLLLSQNENALDLINNYILKEFDRDNNKIKIIFGSSFPNDQKYSQICRKIHQIKLSMELGKTVILMNLENLYESLYDALNQFYYKFGDNEKFVDLGLGTQRVKCLVHNDFRLIVVADKTSVYNPKKYPIPLVNRLEKHLLSIESILDSNMKEIVQNLKDWCQSITKISEKYSGSFMIKRTNLKPSDIFIGFTEDSIPTLVFKLFQETNNKEQCIEQAQNMLIQCGTSDGIIRLLQANLNKNQTFHQLENDKISLNKVVESYFLPRIHDNFTQFFSQIIHSKQPANECSFIQITTHSKLLSSNDFKTLSEQYQNVCILPESLLAFDTQSQFIQVLKEFFNYKSPDNDETISNNVLIIQCDCGHFYQELINCARYTINDEYSKYLLEKSETDEQDPYDDAPNLPEDKDELKSSNVNFHVILIIQIPKISGGCLTGFQTNKWLCYHIDDLQDNFSIGNLLNYKDKSLGDLFSQAVTTSSLENVTLMCILRSIVYIACSKINDYTSSKNNNSRSIRRIEILNDLLSKKQNAFCSILLKNIAKLQIEREHLLSTNELSKLWLFNEAAKLTNVIKYGTLKNSCINYIENRLSHLFSGVIALFDTHNNLDLLDESNDKWLAEIWIKMFDNEQIINFEYEKYFLQSNNKEKHEFICVSKELNIKSLKLKLPFSWIVKQYLDELTHLKIKELENTDQSSVKYMLNQLRNAFGESSMHKALTQLISDDKKALFIKLYLNDFVILSFRESFLSVEHFSLVVKRIKEYVTQEFGGGFIDLASLVNFHLAYEDLKQELDLFFKFVLIETTIIDKLEKSENYNVNLCYLATKIISHSLSTASPKMKQLEWNEWFKKTKKFSLLIETFIRLFPQNKKNEQEQEEYSQFRSIWHKVVVLKFFIENVCHIDDKMYVKCIQLWNYLDKIEMQGEIQRKIKTNFKKYESFERLMKFLNMMTKSLKKTCMGCNKPGLDFYSIGCKPECNICEKCKEQFKTSVLRKCPVCSNDKFSLADIKVTHNYSKLKSGFNCFFMEIVTNLCLDGTSDLPESPVIESIIENLLPKMNRNEESKLIVLDFNLSPSIKSTLFQLLLNYNQQDVEKHLTAIFSKSAQFLRENYETEDLADLKLIYINSIENNFYSKRTLNKTDDNLHLDMKLGLQFLNDLCDSDESPDEIIEQLKIIAKIKFIIVTLSKVISQLNEDDSIQMSFIRMARRFMQSQSSSKWPRFYLIKYVFRRFGKNLLMNTRKINCLNWILPEDPTDELVDSFVICGTNYRKIRNSLRDSFFSGDFSNLASIDRLSEVNTMMYYSMAIFKEITLCRNEIENYGEKCEELLKALETKFGASNKPHFENLIEKKNLPAHFIQDNNYLNIGLLVMHINLVLSTSNLEILKPFVELLNKPSNYKNAFLPSLPHDDDYELFQEFKKLNKEAAKFYKCSNGHLYTIGDCTKPAVTGKCPTCGDTIGGAGYQLAAGNSAANDPIEKTQHGYCLPIKRNDKPESIRNMGILNTNIMRLILHSVLYLSSIRSDNVKEIISPEIKYNNVRDFFAEQILKDVDILSNYLQHSPDESLLIVHYLLSQLVIVKQHTEVAKLKTQENRNNYEKKICNELFTKLIGNDSDKIIKQMTNVINEDVLTAGTDQVYRIAHDMVAVSTDTNREDFLNDKKYWSFRKQINVESMVNNFNSCSQQSKNHELKLLNEFTARMPELEALKYLPAIAKMITLMHVTFNRQIDKQYANSTKLGEFLAQKANLLFKDYDSNKVIKSGCTSLLKVWKIIRSSINSKFNSLRVSKLDVNNAVLDQEDFEQIPLSYLLPGTFKQGRYIYCIVFYLIHLQNDFMQFFFKHKDEHIDLNSIEKVELNTLSATNCVSFTIDKDILQIVFMHSNYSLGLEQDINIEYNFNKIQHTIEKRFLEEKCLIDSNSIPLIEYSDDINDMSRFEALNRRVQQIELPYVMKEKISSFYKQPNELNEIIRKLHIVIDFVIAIGCKPETKIMDYACETLKMTNLEESSINKQVNELDVVYLKSLWNLLSFRRILLLTHHGQDAIDKLDDKFKEKIQQSDDDNDKQLKELILAGKSCVNSINLFNILNLLYKLIVYKLIPESEVSNNTETDQIDSSEIEISDLILELFEQTITDPQNKDERIDLSEYHLKDLKAKHSYHVWKLFVAIYFDNLKK